MSERKIFQTPETISEARIAEIRRISERGHYGSSGPDVRDLLAALDAAKTDLSAMCMYRNDWKARAGAAEAERDWLKEKLTDAQTYVTKANADVQRIMADTDRVWGSMPAAVEKITALEAERDKLKAEIEELDFLRHEGGPDSVAAIEAERDRMRATLQLVTNDLAELIPASLHHAHIPLLAARVLLAQEPS